MYSRNAINDETLSSTATVMDKPAECLVAISYSLTVKEYMTMKPARPRWFTALGKHVKPSTRIGYGANVEEHRA